MWDLIRDLHAAHLLSWCCVGDFNEILDGREKQEGARRDEGVTDAFHEACRECSLKDLGYEGSMFMWRGIREGIEVLERLDRGLENPDWRSLFPRYRIRHLMALSSDHIPFCLDTDTHAGCRNNKRSRYFRFEEVWLREDPCAAVVEGVWEACGKKQNATGFMQRIGSTAKALSGWGRTHFDITVAQESLQQAQCNCSEEGGAKALRNAEMHLNELLEREEVMWRQHSRVDWMKYGDRNTSFFHSKASGGQRRNQIDGLEDDGGIWNVDETEVSSIAINYYETMFKSSTPSGVEFCLDGVEPMVYSMQNCALLAPISSEKVKTALFQMYPTKASGSDGMSALFYQKFWSIVGEDVVGMVRCIMLGTEDLTRVNETTIVLIPKVKALRKFFDYRPISLCNVNYKIVAKVLANRIRGTLPSIISENQSAFVVSRMITDNFLIAFETMHYLRSKRNGRKGYMALKLDMSKAYDVVKWVFLKKFIPKLSHKQ